MGTAVRHDGHQIVLSDLSTNWNTIEGSTDNSNEPGMQRLKISNIQFNCDTVDDTMIIRNQGTSDSTPIFDVTCIVADQAVSKDYYGSDGTGLWCCPYFWKDDVTITGTSTVIITLA